MVVEKNGGLIQEIIFLQNSVICTDANNIVIEASQILNRKKKQNRKKTKQKKRRKKNKTDSFKDTL